MCKGPHVIACFRSAQEADLGVCLLQVLGTALGTALALEQAVYSGNLDISKGRQLQKLCTTATAVIELAGARVQVTPQSARD